MFTVSLHKYPSNLENPTVFMWAPHCPIPIGIDGDMMLFLAGCPADTLFVKFFPNAAFGAGAPKANKKNNLNVPRARRIFPARTLI